MIADDNRRFWVLGGRWVEGGRHLPWPRVYGPFDDVEAARASARQLNDMGEPDGRYVVVADLPSRMDEPACDRSQTRRTILHKT